MKLYHLLLIIHKYHITDISFTFINRSLYVIGLPLLNFPFFFVSYSSGVCHSKYNLIFVLFNCGRWIKTVLSINCKLEDIKSWKVRGNFMFNFSLKCTIKVTPSDNLISFCQIHMYNDEYLVNVTYLVLVFA